MILSSMLVYYKFGEVVDEVPWSVVSKMYHKEAPSFSIHYENRIGKESDGLLKLLTHHHFSCSEALSNSILDHEQANMKVNNSQVSKRATYNVVF